MFYLASFAGIDEDRLRSFVQHSNLHVSDDYHSPPAVLRKLDDAGELEHSHYVVHAPVEEPFGADAAQANLIDIQELNQDAEVHHGALFEQ